MDKHILITGGAGFIGNRLAHQLISLGYRVTVMDNLSEQIHDQASIDHFINNLGGIKFIMGDVRKREDWMNAIKGVGTIVHLAAETGTGQSMYQIARYAEVNIQGTAIMLDILANTKHKVKKTIVASSRAIYGEGKYICPKKGPVYPEHRLEKDMLAGNYEVTLPGSGRLKLVATDEGSKIHPSSLYGITKQVQEQMVMNVCPLININAVAFRYQNVYGPGQSLSNPYTGILSIFSTQIKNGNPINIFEDGLESRDFVYIDDVVDATILGIEKDEANNQVFNVGSGINTTVMDVAKLLVRLYMARTPIKVSGSFRIGDIRHNFADISKIKTMLGFTPKYTFKKGLQLFTEWVENQEIKSDNYEKAMEEMKRKGLYKKPENEHLVASCRSIT